MGTGNVLPLEDATHDGRTASRWFGQVPRDVVLIVVGALLAIGGEELRDARHRRSRVDAALTSIRDELKLNASLVTEARAHHEFLADTLGKLVARHARPDVAMAFGGMFNPAIVTSTAWQAARETGALGDVPLATMLIIAPAYEAQDRYRALSESVGASLMADIRHDGMDAVMRDHFAQFVPLDYDFSHREQALLARYKTALDSLASRR